MQEVLAKGNEWIDAFHAAGLPIVIVNVNPSGAPEAKNRKEVNMGRRTPSSPTALQKFTKLVDEVKALTTDVIVTKETWNAFLIRCCTIN